MDTESISRNTLVKTMEMTAVIQYILTAAQSFDCRDYFNKFLMTIGGLAGVLFFENEQTDTKWIIIFPEQNTSVLRKAEGGLQATAGKRVTTLLSLYPHSFLLLSVSFSHVFPAGRLCSKSFSAHFIDTVGLSQVEL